jgi:ribosomal protein L7/L12
MSSHLKNLTAATKITSEYDHDTATYTAAVRLQLAILAAMSRSLRLALPKRKPKLIDGLTPEEAKLASDRNGKIPAIKLVRERRRKYNPDGTFGLKEAKDLVEDWMEKHLGFRSWPRQDNYTQRSEFKQYDSDQYQQARGNS